MKILVSVHRFPPYVGGSERVSAEIVQALVEDGHSVTVATEYHKGREQSGSFKLVEFHARRGTLPAVEITRYRTLFEDDFQVRIIYAAQSWQLDAVADLVGRDGDGVIDILAPVGMSRLGSPGWEGYFRDLVQWMGRFDALIFHSELYQDYKFARMWIKDSHPRFAVIPNAADILPIVQLERSLDVVTASSHLRSKGHRYLRNLVRTEPWKVGVIAPHGSIPDMRWCEVACRAQARLSRRMSLIDGRESSTVRNGLLSAKCFYLPSDVECSPLVIFESMAASTPWVSFDVGNVAELPGGLVVQSHSEAKRVIRELLSDSEMRAEVGSQGRESVARRFNWESVRKMYSDLVKEIT